MIFLEMMHCMSVVGRLREVPTMIVYCFSWCLLCPLGPRFWHQPTNFACTAATGDTDTASTIVRTNICKHNCPNLSCVLVLQALASSICMHDRMLSEPPVEYLTELNLSMQM